MDRTGQHYDRHLYGGARLYCCQHRTACDNGYARCGHQCGRMGTDGIHAFDGRVFCLPPDGCPNASVIKIYFLSLLVFTAGSFMCGSSSTIEELIFWRVIEGFGCGMLPSRRYGYCERCIPARTTGTALGFWSIASAASVSFGPTIGGYLVDYMDWNYIFYVNIPIGILALIVTAIVQKEHVKGTKVPFDIPGFITSAIFLPVFMYGLSEVNSSTNSMGWNSPVVLGAMWIAVVTFILFLYFEFTVRTPLINLRLFVDKDFALSNLILFVFGIGMFGSTFLIPLYLQDNLGYSALQAGMFLCLWALSRSRFAFIG